MVGGWTGSVDLSSTEILESGSSYWQSSSPLPLLLHGLHAMNYMNTILVFGKMCFMFITNFIFQYFNLCRRK